MLKEEALTRHSHQPEGPEGAQGYRAARVQDSVLPLQTVLRVEAKRKTQRPESRLK